MTVRLPGALRLCLPLRLLPPPHPPVIPCGSIPSDFPPLPAEPLACPFALEPAPVPESRVPAGSPDRLPAQALASTPRPPPCTPALPHLPTPVATLVTSSGSRCRLGLPGASPAPSPSMALAGGAQPLGLSPGVAGAGPRRDRVPWPQVPAPRDLAGGSGGLLALQAHAHGPTSARCDPRAPGRAWSPCTGTFASSAWHLAAASAGAGAAADGFFWTPHTTGTGPSSSSSSSILGAGGDGQVGVAPATLAAVQTVGETEAGNLVNRLEQVLGGPFSTSPLVAPPEALVVVISGPSGVGKDAVIQRLQEVRPALHFVVTATSRPMRPGETHGRDYFFITRDEFEGMIAQNELLEHAVVYGDYKGIPKQQIREALEKRTDVVLRLDVQGAATVRKLLGGGGVFIFLTADNEHELVHRLVGRKTEPLERLVVRVSTARQELTRLPEFDYVVVNKDGCLDETVHTLCSIIDAEKARLHRQAARL